MENSLNIFVLEDSLERIKWFEETFEDCNIFFTKKVKEACEKLRSEKYDLIFLDRDLGSIEENGEEVANMMRKEKLSPNACIIIHTVNPFGQANMKKYLKSYHKNVNMIDFTQLIKMKREDFKIN